MPLTYKIRRTFTSAAQETVTLEVPKHWSMFTPKGNKRLETLAQRAYDGIEALKSGDQLTQGLAWAILLSFIMGWEKMERYKSYREAGDTAVRECVGDFCDKLALASGIWDEYSLGNLWEQLRSESWRLQEIARRKKRG
jgi:hypothetical protein